MLCSICGGDVLWQGPLSSLTHTKCQRCGACNSQLPDRFDKSPAVISNSDELIMRFLRWADTSTPRGDTEYQDILRSMREHIGDGNAMVLPNA
jgi:ferredoxin